MKRILFLLFILMFLLNSCDNSVVFKQFNKMENVNWNRFDIQVFEVEVEKDELYDFYLAFRHHTYFPYDKLWVNITFYTPDGATRSRDYDFDLKDADGNWLADGMGELWDIEFPIRKEMMFNNDGICKVRVENIHSKYDMPGVIEVGLIVKESKN